MGIGKGSGRSMGSKKHGLLLEAHVLMAINSSRLRPYKRVKISPQALWAPGGQTSHLGVSPEGRWDCVRSQLEVPGPAHPTTSSCRQPIRLLVPAHLISRQAWKVILLEQEGWDQTPASALPIEDIVAQKDGWCYTLVEAQETNWASS